MTQMSFRFRGRIPRLLNLVSLFQRQPKQGLHPAQIARQTGMSIVDVDDRLQRTPELFVRIPKRADGMTRYRLTTAVSSLSDTELAAKLNALARRETLVLYAFTSGLILLGAIMLLLIGPVI